MKLKSLLIVTLITCFAQAQEERSTTKFTDSIDAYLKAREIKESFNRSEYDEYFKKEYEEAKERDGTGWEFLQNPELEKELIEARAEKSAYCFTRDKLWREKRPSAVEQSKQRAEIEAYRQYLNKNCSKWEAEVKRLLEIVDKEREERLEKERKAKEAEKQAEIKRQEELIRLLKAQEERAKKESKK